VNQTIVIERTRKDLSAISGLIFFSDLINRLNLDGKLGTVLPKRLRSTGSKAANKFVLGIMAFIAGADCIEDLEIFRKDPLFGKLAGTMASTTMGKFLRSFRLKEIEKLQNLLPELALALRQKLGIEEKVVITMDSTPHEQHGLKMEGVEWNYKSMWCLDSQNAFDQYGFCYGWHLRKGSTYSGNGAVEMIERIFKKIPKDHKRYFRADSAYSNLAVYNALLSRGIHFAICLKENVWAPLVDNYEFKMGWKKTSIRFFDSNRCQVASCLYPIKGLQGRSFLRVVFIRAQKKNRTKEDKRHYDYYAVVTDMPESEMSNDAIIDFYRKRANAENHIKDLKYGMDFKHFPCQKLNANRGWGMMGIYAYNLMRFASFILFPSKGCFLKKVRTRMVNLACEIRKGQRKIELRFTNHIYQEVQRLQNIIHSLFCPLGPIQAFGRLRGEGLSPPS